MKGKDEGGRRKDESFSESSFFFSFRLPPSAFILALLALAAF
jgi:hypothetical protein